jgi:glycosyltransferase involved in cell wall biosynthesis
MNIGFVSTRFAGLDGVSLEADKWAQVFEAFGHHCFWFGGELDKPTHCSYRAAGAHFQHPENRWINNQVFGQEARSERALGRIHELRGRLKAHLAGFIRHFGIDLIVVENASAIPMHLPLGLAVTDMIAEYGLSAIGHHHDFSWERSRFVKNGVRDIIEGAFPPDLPEMRHVVINSQARRELWQRKGLPSEIIPNVCDFERPVELDPDRTRAFRRAVDVGDDETLLLQPTRIIPRKGIEQAVSLAARLGRRRCALVISHPAGDEGLAYASKLRKLAARMGARLVFAAQLIGDSKSAFTLWEAYQASDFITYPSLVEGFGNALLEAVYFRKPVLINRYSTYVSDIRPAGFHLVEMDGAITDAVLDKVKALLSDSALRRQVTSHNFELGLRNYSLKVLRNRLPAVVDAALSGGERVKAAVG